LKSNRSLFNQKLLGYRRKKKRAVAGLEGWGELAPALPGRREELVVERPLARRAVAVNEHDRFAPEPPNGN
jgi:hypothetical protein